MVAAWNGFGRQECHSVEGEGFIGFENHWLFGGVGDRGVLEYVYDIYLFLFRRGRVLESIRFIWR
jgi:hypothetical protein